MIKINPQSPRLSHRDTLQNFQFSILSNFIAVFLMKALRIEYLKPKNFFKKILRHPNIEQQSSIINGFNL